MPRNPDIWAPFGEAGQQGKEVPLVSLAARWLYGPTEIEEDPPSPLTASGEVPTGEGEPLATGLDNEVISLTPTLPRATTVSIPFDLDHAAHQSMPVHPLDSGDRMSRYTWTEAQRAHAKLAKDPHTVDELREEV